jgi:hypothetical protein
VSALWPIQTAVMARLLSDAPLAALVGTRIYDGEAPQESALPYLVLGEPTETDASPLGTRGYTDTLTLHAFSAYQGRKEVLDITSAVELALRPPLALDGHTTARARLEMHTVLIEEDGIRHAAIRYRFFTFATA